MKTKTKTKQPNQTTATTIYPQNKTNNNKPGQESCRSHQVPRGRDQRREEGKARLSELSRLEVRHKVDKQLPGEQSFREKSKKAQGARKACLASGQHQKETKKKNKKKKRRKVKEFHPDSESLTDPAKP